MTNLIRLQSIDKLQLLRETVNNYKQTFFVLKEEIVRRKIKEIC